MLHGHTMLVKITGASKVMNTATPVGNCALG